MTEEEFDAYGVLRVTPNAEDYVLEAAFRALARHFHPDGATPDEAQMAEINRAYGLIRTPERRKRYDRLHRSAPMGPGMAAHPNGAPVPAAFGGRVPPPTDGPGGLRAGEPDPGMMTIDFGRYAGWRLKDLAKQDPDYLRWLSRHSSGVRYRNQITALLGMDGAPTRR
jgi:curved DNA-binding protein CbpA